jgi:preprotein translocase subunit SecE
LKEINIVAKTANKTGSAKKVAEKKSSGPSNPVTRYLRETRGELRKVTWPTRDESWRLTLIVLGVSLVMSVFLWIFDTVFSNSIEFLLQQLIGF